jgi:hypothetical protein
MPLAVLLTIVAIALSALMASSVSNAIRSTRADVQGVQALTAAQAGLDVSLARILAAHDSAGAFVVDDLPCAPLVGRAGGDGAGAYRATIGYFDTDPHGRDDAWLAANGSPCAAAGNPRYAVLTVVGTDGAGGTERTLTGTYAFPTPGTPKLPGGPIRLPTALGTPDLCIAAAQAVPAAGTALQLSPCVPGSAAQTFAYQPDLNLVVASADHPDGLCADAGAAPVAGDALMLRPCATPAVARQQWRYNRWRNFQGPAGLCLTNASGALRLGSTAAGTCTGRPDPAWVPDRVQSWVPGAGVGVGAAGAAAKQLVNAGEYARCLVAPTDPQDTAGATAWPYLEVSACDQQTSAAAVPWSQRWHLPALGAGPIWFAHPSRGQFCLTAPTVGLTPPVVTAEPCVATAVQVPSRMWTVRTMTGSWEGSYRIEDLTGRCLASSNLARGWYADTAVATACDASAMAKWNADPSVFRPRLRYVGER